MEVGHFTLEILDNQHLRLMHDNREIHIRADTNGLYIDVYGSANDDDLPDANLIYRNHNDK